VNDARDSGVRDRILQTASDLFYVDGLRGVGVNRIIEEADVAKSTLYRYFPTKEYLVLAYLDEMDRLWTAALRQAAGTDPTPTADSLAGMFDALLWDGHPEEYRGAAFLKASADEVDEGVAVDALVTNRNWTALGLDPANTPHDVRWGEECDGEFVWVFEISGSVPASHNGGYDKSYSMRQPAMFFPKGGGTLSGVSKPGEIVWSRVFIMDGELHLDLGRGHVVRLPPEETQRRLNPTDPQWPIMHAVLNGVSRDQLMARHKANHAQVVYAPDAETADALAAKAAFFEEPGVKVHLCGNVSL
jgi:hypothetical protein